MLVLILLVFVTNAVGKLWSEWRLQHCINKCGRALLVRGCMEDQQTDRVCSGNLYFVKNNFPDCRSRLCHPNGYQELQKAFYDSVKEHDVSAQNLIRSKGRRLVLTLPPETLAALSLVESRFIDTFWSHNAQRLNLTTDHKNLTLSHLNINDTGFYSFWAITKTMQRTLLYAIAVQLKSPPQTILGTGKSYELTCPVTTIIPINVSFGINWFINNRLQRRLGGAPVVQAAAPGLWECRVYIEELAKEFTLVAHQIAVVPAYMKFIRSTLGKIPWEDIGSKMFWIIFTYFMIVCSIYTALRIYSLYAEPQHVTVDKLYTKKIDAALRKNTSYSREDFEKYFKRNYSFNSLIARSTEAMSMSPNQLPPGKLLGKKFVPNDRKLSKSEGAK